MTRWYVYQAFAMAFVRHYLSLPCAPVHSCALMCVRYAFELASVRHYSSIPCIPVRSCAFAIAPNQPWLEIHQSCALLIDQIGLCWTLSCTVSTLCPNCRVFMGNFYCLEPTLVGCYL